MEAMAGTFVMRSVIPGEAGEITLAGDDRVLKAIGLNTIQNAEESTFVVDITDAHTGKAVVEDYSVSKNQLLGVLNENVDIEFSSWSGTGVSWDNSSKYFVLMGGEENISSTFITIKDNSQRLHTGAGKNEEIAFTIGNLSLKSLGIDYLSVADNDSANDSLGKIDQASQKLSQERSKLGALQNRLEKSLEISENTMENITTAESRIRDTDMAKEAMLLAKQQILVQSSQAMLSQANQISSSSYEGIKQMIG
jgi:flagellin